MQLVDYRVLITELIVYLAGSYLVLFVSAFLNGLVVAYAIHVELGLVVAIGRGFYYTRMFVGIWVRSAVNPSQRLTWIATFNGAADICFVLGSQVRAVRGA